MCKEDLGLGRGRVKGQAVTTTVSLDNALPANPKRVALILTSMGTSTFDNAGGIVSSDYVAIAFNGSQAGPLEIAMRCPIQPVVMDIETWGSMITQPIGIQLNNTSGGNVARLVEIVTEVQQRPITE